jgi:ABC-2 type transport system ATP-binding protein
MLIDAPDAARCHAVGAREGPGRWGRSGALIGTVDRVTAPELPKSGTGTEESEPVEEPIPEVEAAAASKADPGAEPESEPEQEPAAAPTPVAAAEQPAEEPAAVPEPDARLIEVAEPSPSAAGETETVLDLQGLTKRFGDTVAVDAIDLAVKAGSFYGIVGPNGAGKTTTLSMVTGLLRPDGGRVLVHGIDVWAEPNRAKRAIGVLPDALRLFDRLSGAQLLHYSGVLRGLDAATVRQRTADLVAAFGLEDATGRLVADYSAGMTKKIALAAAMIHSPRLLVLDEPFESVDPVSAANIVEILQRYVAAGGTVVLSSHGMDLIQRVCDHVAVIVGGRVLAAGTTDEVRGEESLEDRFVALAGGRRAAAGMEWLHSFTE